MTENTRTTIQIEWLCDYSDCDTCGMNYSSGARVTLDGKELLNLVPAASCFGGDHWDELTVYELILQELGYDVTKEY